MNQPHPYLTPRQKAREVAFQFLFRLDQINESLSMGEIETEFKKHVEHFQVSDEIRDFSMRLVKHAGSALSQVDEMIAKHAQNWRIERIGAVEKAFLRMGTAELLFFKDVPASVTLNEVVELSKYFGEAETPAFLNGILDPISKEPSTLAGKVASE